MSEVLNGALSSFDDVVTAPTTGRSFGSGSDDMFMEDPIYLAEQERLEQEKEDAGGWDLEEPEIEDESDDFDFSMIDSPDEFEEPKPEVEVVEEEDKPVQYNEEGFELDEDGDPVIDDSMEFILHGRIITLKDLIDHRLKEEAKQAEFVDLWEQKKDHLESLARVEQLPIDVFQLDRLEHLNNNINWARLSQEDPYAFKELDDERTLLTQRISEARAELDARKKREEAEADERFEREYQENLDRAVGTWKELEKDIPYWSLQHWNNIQVWAVGQGMSYNDVGNVTDPAIVKMMNKAYLFDNGEPDWKPKVAIKKVVKMVKKPQVITNTKPKMDEVPEYYFKHSNQLGQRSSR